VATPDRPLLGRGEALRRDVERPARGGKKFHPQSVDEAQALLRPQVAALVETVETLPPGQRARRVVFEATLLPNYLAASYFPAALFETVDLVPIGTRPATGTYRTRTEARADEPTKRLIVAGTETSIARLEALVEGTLSDRRTRAALESLRELSEIAMPTPVEIARAATDAAPRQRAGEGERALWEAVLHPLDVLDAVSASGRLRGVERERSSYEKWITWLAGLGGSTLDEYRRTGGGLTFVPILLEAALVGEAAQFNPLRTIRPMPQMRPLPRTRFRRVASARVKPLAVGTQPRSRSRVAVFDGGIHEPAPLFDPFVVEVQRTADPKDADATNHGSAITAAVLYGYIANGDSLHAPPAAIDHHRVFPERNPLDPDAYWVLDQIVDAVSKNTYPIVNLSLGPDLPIDDDTPHLWTIELDRLAYEKGTLFVTAVGNTGDDVLESERRIQPPADAVNGVGVGAATARAPAPWRRASYSSVGPGRAGGRSQPTGLAFGGSDAAPFEALVGDGSFITGETGTSFAAPLCTHALAELAADLGPQRTSAATLRAFLVHFAENDSGVPMVEAGFGRLRERFEDVWQAPGDSVTVLYQDALARDQTVALQLPWPDAVTAGRVRLRWTLAFTTSTDATDPVDYTRSGIELTFRPHSRRLTFTDDAGRARVVDVDDFAALEKALSEGRRPSAHAATRSAERLHATEALRRTGGKWETIIHQRDRLRAGSLHRPEVHLAYLERDSGLLVKENVPPLDYSFLVTMHGPAGLYDAVRKQYPVLVPIRPQTAVPVRVPI
jgi:hypothetical protein